MIGFSRFGQIAAQILLTGGSSVTIIDHSAERVRSAAKFGFRLYFGDGTRKDVLEASGIRRAKIVAVCTNKRAVTDRIVDLIQSEFPDARLFVRSYDRTHTLELQGQGRRLRIARDLRIGPALRPEDAGSARHGRGHGKRDPRGRAPPRRGAAGAAGRRRHPGRPRPLAHQAGHAGAAHQADARSEAARQGGPGEVAEPSGARARRTAEWLAAASASTRPNSSPARRCGTSSS